MMISQLMIYPFWHNGFFYLSILLLILLISVVFTLIKMFKNKSSEIKYIQQQQIAKIDILRKEHSENLENLRIEMLKREEERTHQWMESEKETLHVLNGVSNLLDLTDKIGRVDSENILNKLDEIQIKVENLKES